MGKDDVAVLAKAIAEELREQHTCDCSLTDAEQQAVKDLLKTKKKTIKFFLWLFGAVSLWLMQDVITRVAGWLAMHMTFNK